MQGRVRDVEYVDYRWNGIFIYNLMQEIRQALLYFIIYILYEINFDKIVLSSLIYVKFKISKWNEWIYRRENYSSKTFNLLACKIKGFINYFNIILIKF